MKCLTLFFLAIAWNASAEDRPLEPTDFFNSQAIELQGTGALYRLDLPESVYSKMHFDDLRDLRVFNAGRAVVPHSFQLRTGDQSRSSQTLPLSFFPIEGPQNSAGGDSEITLTEGTNRTVSVRLKGNKPSPKDVRLGYLVDLRAQELPVRALLLDWKSNRKNGIVALDVAASDDLGAWRTVASQLPLARFAYQGQNLENNLLEIPETKAKYLRVTWNDDPSFQITKLEGEFASESWVEAKRFETEVSPTQSEGNRYFFEKAPMLADRISVQLPEENTVVRVVLSSRGSKEGPWSQRTSGTVYKVRRGQDLFTSGPLKMQPESDRYWMLQIEGKEASLGKAQPKLKFGWVAHHLFFLARGEGPFQLAFGNAKAQVADFGFPSLIDALPETDGNKVEVTPAQLTGDILSNEAAIQKAVLDNKPGVPWRKYGLWGFLAGALILSSFMAWRLYGELNKKA